MRHAKNTFRMWDVMQAISTQPCLGWYSEFFRSPISHRVLLAIHLSVVVALFCFNGILFLYLFRAHYGIRRWRCTQLFVYCTFGVVAIACVLITESRATTTRGRWKVGSLFSFAHVLSISLLLSSSFFLLIRPNVVCVVCSCSMWCDMVSDVLYVTSINHL